MEFESIEDSSDDDLERAVTVKDEKKVSAPPEKNLFDSSDEEGLENS